MATAIAPLSEADVRTFMEARSRDFRLSDRGVADLDEAAAAFGELVGDEVSDEDYEVFTAAYRAALESRLGTLNEAVRQALIEANVAGATAFLECFPAAPLRARR
jgi:hypothetical protein